MNLFECDLEWLMPHVFLSAIFSWFALAMLAFFLFADSFLSNSDGRLRNERSMVIELVVVISVVTLIFTSYVSVQIGYLFGGVDHIRNTPNLTLAEYARRGFFESAAAYGIVLILLQTCGEYVERRSDKHYFRFSMIACALIALSLVVVASGYQRIMIYTEHYGLTQDRFYVYVGLTWIAFYLVLMIVTFVLPLRRRFIVGAIGLAYATLFVTAVLNPDGFVAWTNLKPLEATGKFDAGYVHQLSADAVPMLVQHRELLGEENWAYVDRMRYNRNARYDDVGFWGWNLGHDRSIRSLESS